MLSGYGHQTETVLEASLCPTLSTEHVSRLFDIIPGLDTCHYDHTTGLSVCLFMCLSGVLADDQVQRLIVQLSVSATAGKALVKYLSPQSAAYARDKLDMFEYPPGYRMSVQFITRSVS